MLLFIIIPLIYSNWILIKVIFDLIREIRVFLLIQDLWFKMIVIFEGREKFFRAENKNSRTLVWTVYRCKTKIYTHVLSVERKRRGRVKTKVGWGEVLLIKSWGRILGLAVAVTYKFTPLSINAIEVLSFCGRRARGQRGNIVYIYIYIYTHQVFQRVGRLCCLRPRPIAPRKPACPPELRNSVSTEIKRQTVYHRS